MTPKLVALSAVCLLATVAAACSESGPEPAGAEPPELTDGGTDAQPTEQPPPAPADAAPEASPVDAAPARALKIQLDYRFDTAGFFADPARKKSLEAAAAIWSSLLKDDFGTVPKGTYATTRNPELYDVPAAPVTLTSDIEGILVFVGSASFPDSPHARASTTAGLSQIADSTLRKSLAARFDGPDHEPWTGWISFNRTREWYFDTAPTAGGAVPNDKVDFVTVALHELGHVLGIGSSPAFVALVQDGKFTGPSAVAVFGQSIPLAPDGVHMPTNFMFGGKEVLMDLASASGERSFPSPVDLAMLKDIGYEL